MSLVSGLLNDTIDIYSITTDKFTDRTRTLVYADVKCRWEEKTSVIVGKDSQEKRAKINAWILSIYTILEDYEIIKDTKIYKIVSVEKKIDIGGKVDHIRLWLT